MKGSISGKTLAQSQARISLKIPPLLIYWYKFGRVFKPKAGA